MSSSSPFALLSHLRNSISYIVYEIDGKNTCAVKARGISRIRISEIAKNQSFILEKVGCNLSYHFCESFYLFDNYSIYDIITNLIAGLGGELYSAKDKYQRQ